MATPDDLARLAQLAERHDLWVISDEVYWHITYGPHANSIAALPGMAQRTVIVDGFSKGYSMTGWRLGYGVMPKALAGPMTTLIINNLSCTATFVQYAGLAALQGPQDSVLKMVAGLKTKRDLVDCRPERDRRGDLCLSRRCVLRVPGLERVARAYRPVVRVLRGAAALRSAHGRARGDGFWVRLGKGTCACHMRMSPPTSSWRSSASGAGSRALPPRSNGGA